MKTIALQNPFLLSCSRIIDASQTLSNKYKPDKEPSSKRNETFPSAMVLLLASICHAMRNTVRAAKCKWNLLIEFRRRGGLLAKGALEEKGWLRSRFDVFDGFPRSACHSRIIVTGGTKRMRGASSIFHRVYAREPSLAFHCKWRQIYTRGDWKKKKRDWWSLW